MYDHIHEEALDPEVVSNKWDIRIAETNESFKSFRR